MLLHPSQSGLRECKHTYNTGLSVFWLDFVDYSQYEPTNATPLVPSRDISIVSLFCIFPYLKKNDHSFKTFHQFFFAKQ
jgi:hypothetical protein